MDADVLRSVVEKLEYSSFEEELVNVSRSREESWWSAATRESWSCSQLQLTWAGSVRLLFNSALANGSIAAVTHLGIILLSIKWILSSVRVNITDGDKSPFMELKISNFCVLYITDAYCLLLWLLIKFFWSRFISFFFWRTIIHITKRFLRSSFEKKEL